MKKARRYFVAAALCGLGFILALPIVVQALQDLGAKPDTPLLTIISAMPVLLQTSPIAGGALVLLLLGLVLFVAGLVLLLTSRFSSASP